MWRGHNSAHNRGKYPFLCTLAAPLLPLRPSILTGRRASQRWSTENPGPQGTQHWRHGGSPALPAGSVLTHLTVTTTRNGQGQRQEQRTNLTSCLRIFFSNTKGCRWEGQTVYWWLENLSLSGRVFIPQPEKESKWGNSHLYSRVNWGNLSGLWSCNYLDTLGNKASHTARWSLADAILKAMGTIRPFKTSALLLEFL